MVLEDFSISEPKTKLAASVFQNLGVEDYILLVLPEEDVKVVKSVRNLPYVDVINLSHLNTYDVLANDRVVFTRASLQQLQEGAEDEGSS